MSLRIRRGGVTPGDPTPTTPAFGPTDGAPAIRAGAGNRSVTLPGTGTDITVGNLTQANVNTAGAGATLKIRAGDHRLTSTVTFLTGQQVYVEDGAKIKGSALVTGWTFDGVSRWSRTGQTQDFTANAAAVVGSSSSADNPVNTSELEDYYLDGVPMIAVTSKAAVTVGSNRKYLDRAADTVWIGVDPAAHTIERLMFFGHLVSTGGNGVEVRGGIFEHSGLSSFQIASYNNLLLEDAEVRYGHLRSLHSSSVFAPTFMTGCEISHCYVHHGGKYNHNLLYHDGLIVQDTEFEAGNDLHFGNRVGSGLPNDEGASKALHTSNMIWRRNWSHGHDGSEWWDTDNTNMTMTESVFEDSYQFGLWTEDNHGVWTISRNYFRDCGRSHPTYGAWASGHHHGNVYVSCSDDITIQDNIFETSTATTYAYEGDIHLSFQSARGGLHDMYVNHNRFNRTRPTGDGRGFVQSRGSEENVRYSVNNNRYNYNEYHVPTGSASSDWYSWGGGANRTFTTWQAGESLPYGPSSYYDPNGTLTADL